MSLQNTQNLVTDLCRDNTQSVLLKQYEKNSRFIIVKCTENGVFKKLDNKTMMCNIKVLTPDDRAIYDSCKILDDGTVKVSVSESMVYTAGVAKAELNIIEQSSTALLSTMIFNIIIKPSAYGDDKIVASEEFSALTKLMTTVEQTVQTVISLETKINNKQTEWEANENTRKTNELARVNAEKTRVSGENTRVTNENSRKSAETTRVSSENTRISNENTRKSQESTRQTNETTRVNSENDRKSAETARNTNENTRISSENTRNTAETNRASAESSRVTAENQRKSNETTRENNETARQQAESLRESNTSTAISNANKATSATNEAIRNANTATNDANTAADRANKAAQDAEAIVLEKIPAISLDFIRSLFS